MYTITWILLKTDGGDQRISPSQWRDFMVKLISCEYTWQTYSSLKQNKIIWTEFILSLFLIEVRAKDDNWQSFKTSHIPPT